MISRPAQRKNEAIDWHGGTATNFHTLATTLQSVRGRNIDEQWQTTTRQQQQQQQQTTEDNTKRWPVSRTTTTTDITERGSLSHIFIPSMLSLCIEYKCDTSERLFRHIKLHPSSLHGNLRCWTPLCSSKCFLKFCVPLSDFPQCGHKCSF